MAVRLSADSMMVGLDYTAVRPHLPAWSLMSTDE
jgi:hypothetical protein